MHSFHLFCSASNWYRNNMDSKPQSKRRTCVYTSAYTQSASGADRSSDSSGPAGVWRATTRSEEPAGCRGLGLGCGSQTLLQVLSVSLCCPPWLRAAGQQSRFLCVFLHWRRQRLPTHINTVAPEGSWLSFHHCERPFSWVFLLLLPCVWGGCVRTACYQRRNEIMVLVLESSSSLWY